MSKTHHLKISNIIQETEESKTLYFEIPTEIKDSFSFIPGQYLTLEFNIKDKKVRRPYSICTEVQDQNIGVNVKKLKGGLVSNHIHDQIKVGDIIDVLSPDGNFQLSADPEKKNNYFFIAAGSGITPIMSMILSVLKAEHKSNIYLLYGNTNENSIIFKSQLDKLANDYSGQLNILHTLTKPIKHKKKGVGGFFSKGIITWTGLQGRIDKNKIDNLIDSSVGNGANNPHFYI